MKKVLFIISNIVFCSIIIVLVFMIFNKNNEYLSLKKQYENSVNLNSEISDIKNSHKDLLSKLDEIKNTLDNKNSEYEELSQKNSELNNNLNDSSVESIKYDDMISEIQNKINNYHN